MTQRYSDKCKKNKEIVHLCYMRPLKDELHTASDKVLTSFSISEIPKPPRTRPRINYMYLTPSACNSFVRAASILKTGTACDAVRGNIRPGKILWGSCLHI